MQKKLAILLVVSALSGVASAQRLVDPFRVEVGLYIPTFSEGSSNLGVAVGAGYSFYNHNGIDVAAVARGDFYHTNQDDGFGGSLGGDVSLGTYGVDVRYRFKGQPFFIGGGLAAAQAHIDVDGGSGDTTKLGYSAEAGYYFSRELYGVVRFQATTDDIAAYRGITVGVGYRF